MGGRPAGRRHAARPSSRAWSRSPPRPAPPPDPARPRRHRILPLRPVVWVAKQVASLPARVPRPAHPRGREPAVTAPSRSWVAAGVPRRARAVRRTDAALRVLPGLVAGLPTRLDGGADSPVIRLAPAGHLPPILVGGMSEAAMLRATDHGDGWFVLPRSAGRHGRGPVRASGAGRRRGRPTPPVTASMVAARPGTRRCRTTTDWSGH